jgi:outer membrane protein TolC
LSLFCAVAAAFSGTLDLSATGGPGDSPDPVVPPALSLIRAIEIAIEHNPRVAASAEGIDAAQGSLSQAMSVVVPRLGVSTQRYTPLNLPEFSFQSPESTWSTNFALSQPLYAGGRLRAGIRAARSLRTGSVASHRRAIQEIAFAVRGSYYGVLTAEQGVKVAQEVMDSALEQARVAGLRYKAGVAPQFDVLAAEARVARVEQSLISTRARLDIARAALSTVMGAPLSGGTQLSTPRFAIHTEGDLASLEAEALAKRPDLLALRAEAAAARERLTIARAGRLPVISARLGWALLEKTTIPGDVFGVPGAEITVSQNTGSVVLAADWNLYDGGQVQGEVTEAKARWRQTEKQVEDLEQRIALAVTTAQVLARAATAQVAAAQRELVQAEEAHRVANIRYQEGVGTSVEILNAEADLEGAKTRLNTAIFDRDLAAAALDLAVGRDWQESIAPEAAGE